MPLRAHSRMKMGYTRPEGWYPDRFNCSATSLFYRLIRMLFGTFDCGSRHRPASTHMSFFHSPASYQPAASLPCADRNTMDLLHTHGAGLDVHKNSVVAHDRITDAKGRVTRHTRTLGTLTADLLNLAAWLLSLEITQVAMEAT